MPMTRTKTVPFGCRGALSKQRPKNNGNSGVSVASWCSKIQLRWAESLKPNPELPSKNPPRTGHDISWFWDKFKVDRDWLNEDPTKVNLVAALVHGMRVEDAAVLQLQVINSARVNATHNHGLDPDRLLIAEAIIGKGLFLKRIRTHGKVLNGEQCINRSVDCRLTVVVREISTPEEEAEIAS
ncbi:hypothetical protein RHSIM_Rhsim03G0060600 [Rhododendron simsii]|uniref:Uncharacterized protein n=1 Tax=Rhododendron simsii TaxID=118357 RepID=A0A834H6J8_RHOSS|nr:hypothetical protein RHSIM_Rhsim03G0060600 [Rhododendron simsii]